MIKSRFLSLLESSLLFNFLSLSCFSCLLLYSLTLRLLPLLFCFDKITIESYLFLQINTLHYNINTIKVVLP